MLDLSRLSAEQRRAVLAGKGPHLLLAGPGSGKTTVLAARIAYLVAARGVPPARILALAFSRRAARELQARLVGLLGAEARAVDVLTFHAFGYRLLRTWGARLGLGSEPPGVCEAEQARQLLLRAAHRVGLDLTPWSLSRLEHDLTRHRSVRPQAPPPEPLSRLLAAYESLLQERNQVDYPAMLSLPLRLLEAFPDIVSQVQAAYSDILVDEFQDVCPLQYRLLPYLAAPGEVFAAGDPCQCIFDWRGADPQLVQRFQTDFPEADTLSLVQNFRATTRLVEVANALAAPLSPPPRQWTGNPPGERPAAYFLADEQAEANWIAAEIEQLRDRRTVRRLREVAVLYRTRDQAGPLSQALQARGLPFTLRGAGPSHREHLPPDHRPSLRKAQLFEGDLETVDEEHVLLTTIHGAKGGEWAVVFVAGFEEGLLPHARSLAENPGLDAERRVAYVAVTRARERLYLTLCRRRGDRERLPSRFLHGLPLPVLDRRSPTRAGA